jgi:hypothetical protein
MLGATSVKFEAENFALAVPFFAAAVDWAGRTLEEVWVELVKTADDGIAGADALEEGAGAAWDTPARKRAKRVEEKSILMNFQASDFIADCLDGKTSWRRPTPGFLYLKPHAKPLSQLLSGPHNHSTILYASFRREASKKFHLTKQRL